ncbi:MAG: cysteine--tRNA ligase [Deltaproteobacteria bacterium]|nr:cysteine--tRNA ligase [Deltaproteobacteria bacterium]RLB24237.1 MAG: cysteine--tRNA ligase [Deltaproteobacteria bacterium]HDH87513.1 cysteine--tRNA ligase [Desulfobacteraceae bacterium]
MSGITIVTKKYNNILDTIGNTPIVPIRHLNRNDKVKIFAKLESFNPGGSIKDRIALSMIEKAERTGQLTKDKIIVEATSGNTGIGLALVAAIKGYRLMLTMSDSVSEERRKILKALGADLRYTSSRLGTDGAIEEAYNLVRESSDKYWLADQSNNESNWMAHYNGTAVEIWEQTGGKVTMAVAAMGTTGTVMGLSKRLKKYKPTIKIVGVEPYLGHSIQGMKNMKESYRPEIFKKDLLDRIVHIEDEEAFQMTRRLAKEEGIFVGMSSGAAMAATLKVAQEIKEGVLVVIFPDGGERYLSTNLFMDKKKTDIKFYNTLTRQKDVFIPIKENEVSIYSCGPTVSKLIDLANCRRYIVADLLRRYLEFKGFAVTHIINITDLDDKTIQGAEAVGEEVTTFTQKYYQEFLKDLDSLNIKRATNYPLASDHVEEMIDFTQKLLQKGYAYERLRSVYFDISRFRDYGKLSRVDLNKIRVGKTVDLDSYEKDNPRDFTLLKRATLNELKRGIFFSTKWGNVRPSWHIECAAMAMEYLGETYDIHTGSTDMIFPHHENNIAILESLTGKPVVNYWIHNELVKEKNITLRDVLNKGYTGREIRYWLTTMHYRKAIDFSWSKLTIAKNTVSRLDRFVHKLRSCQKAPHNSEIDQLIYDLRHKFTEKMDDDLNIAPALAALFEFMHHINRIMDSKGLDPSDRDKIEAILSRLNSVLMVMDLAEPEPSQQIENLTQERDDARQKKDWAKADKIRNELKKLGVEVIDTKDGTRWRKIT